MYKVGRKKFFNFKSLFLASFLAIAGIFSAGAFVVNEQIKETPVVEKAEAATNRTLKLHYNEAGDNKSWETLDVLYGHDNQYECVVYLKAGCMFGFQVFDGSTQKNWIGYKSNLSSTYFQSSSGSDGGNIKVKSGQSGVYSIYISSDIDNYGGPSDGYWIWQNNKSGMTKLSDSPAYVLGKIKGQNKWSTSTTDYPFTWDATSHRYKTTLDLYVNDEIKIYRSSDSRYTGWAAALTESTSGSYGFVGDSSYTSNIPIVKKCRLTIYLGASYNFYGDAEAGWIADPSSDTSGKNYYFSYMEATALYDVTIQSNNVSYGTVTQSTISDVPSGATITISSNKVTINDITVTANPASETAQYTYAFSSWTNATGTVTANRTITANFTRTTRKYTVSFVPDDSGYGTVSGSSIANVPYGTAISVSGNSVTINGTTITANPIASTDQYTYAFSSWSNATGTVTGTRTITANFTRTTNNYNLAGTATNGTVQFYSDSLGNTPITSANYGASIYYRGIGNTGYGNTAITATTVNGTNFTFSSGTATLKATPVCPANEYTITYKDQGNVTYSGSNIEDLPDTHTYGVATELVDGEKIGYEFDGWFTTSTCTGDPITSIGATQITADTTLYAKWTAKTSALTFAPHGGTGAYPASGILVATYGQNMPTYSSDPLTAPEGYTFGGYWTGENGTGTCYYDSSYHSATTWAEDTTDGTTLHAYWIAKTTTVTFDKNGGEGGSDGFTATYDAAVPDIIAPTKTGYTFQGYYTEGGYQIYTSTGKGGKIWGDDSATATLYARWNAISYAVTITGGTGISSVYLSTNASATSGSASGTSFAYGSTVYGFVVLEAGYAHNEVDWDEYVLISGTADTAGAIYRVGSLAVKTSGNAFGTISPISGAQDAKDFWEASFNDFLDGVCEDDGSTNFNDLLYEWNVNIYSVDYCDLEEYQKYWLTDADAGESIGIDYSRYDYILHKYGCTDDPEEYDIKLYDFLGRFDGVQLPAINNISPFKLISDDENNASTIIIIVASSLSLLSITALSVLMVKKRKRKEQ